MPITELLITGYDGCEAVFAVNLAPDEARVVMTSTDGRGDPVVDSTGRLATELFIEVRQQLERITRLAATV